MSKKEKFPKYWCFPINYGSGGIVHDYREIPDQNMLDKVNKKRETLPDWRSGFITDCYRDAIVYAND